jgi:tRNA nucleotidyltransferase (CCA-adding enzyme)
VDTRRLKAAVPNDVLDICRRLKDAGFRSWVVGGCVRDEMLAELNAASGDASTLRNDWDIATSARPEDVTRLFRRVIPTGLQHGTVTVVMGREHYELTTLRGESAYSDGRRPDSVYFVDDIADDLARRDFTINAIAYDPLEDRLIDPFGGLDDLKLRRLRAVGEPAMRFSEDGLRVLRAARFAATLEVELDEATARAIQPSLDSYRKVSSERIRDEWVKTMKARKPSRAFEIMREHGLLAITAPELLESVGCEQNKYHAYDVWGHAMECLNACPALPVLRVAGLLHDVGKPRSRAFSEKTNDYTFYEHERIGAEMADPMLERLRFSNDERARIVSLVRHHLVCYDGTWSDAAVRRWVRRVSPELVEDLYLLNAADILSKGREVSDELKRLEDLKAHVARVMAAGAALSIKELNINGSDLMREVGIKPGPELGRILKTLLEEVVENPEQNTREILLQRAHELKTTD